MFSFLWIAEFDFRGIFVNLASIEVLNSSWSRELLNSKITKIKNEIADAADTALERDRSMSHRRDVWLTILPTVLSFKLITLVSMATNFESKVD